MDVNGLSCVVTGAASGIGLEVARGLRAGGATVTALDRHPVEGVDGVETVELDLADPASIDVAVARLDGAYDALVNVAGLPGTFDGDLVMKVNFLGLRYLTESLLDRLRPGASIVNVASIAGFDWFAHRDAIQELLATTSFEEGLRWFESHVPEGNAYNFSKEAVIVYTMASALRLRERELRMNAVLPGAVETPILVNFEESMGKELLEGVRELLGRHGTAQDIAPAVQYLVSPASRWTVGSTITVDGGLMGAVGAGLVPAPSI